MRQTDTHFISRHWLPYQHGRHRYFAAHTLLPTTHTFTTTLHTRCFCGTTTPHTVAPSHFYFPYLHAPRALHTCTRVFFSPHTTAHLCATGYTGSPRTQQGSDTVPHAGRCTGWGRMGHVPLPHPHLARPLRTQAPLMGRTLATPGAAAGARCVVACAWAGGVTGRQLGRKTIRARRAAGTPHTLAAAALANRGRLAPLPP